MIAIALVPVLLLLPFVNAPFERDEAVYAMVARGLLDDAVPYRDLFDHKPPFLHFWYAVSFTAFGDRVEAPRLLAMLFYSGTVLTVFAQARRLMSRRSATLAGAVMGATAGLVMLRAVANAEIFTMLPALLALLAATRGLQVSLDGRSRAWKWFLLAGALSGVAVVTKQVALFPTAAIGVVILLASPYRVRDTGAFILGGLAVFALVVTPFVVAGAWDDFFYANFTYNRLYFAADGPSPLASTVRFLLIASPLVIGAALGAWSLWTHDRRIESRLLLLWAGANVASVFSTGRAYEHYWVMALPALALLVGYAVAHPPAPLREQVLLRAGLGLTLTIGLFVSVAANLPIFLHGSADERHVAQYGASGLLDLEAQRVAAELRELLAPGEVFYEVGRETSIYFHADVLPPVRFTFDRQFYLDTATLDEAMVELRRGQPEFVLLTRPTDDPPYSDGAVPLAIVGGRLVPPPIAEFLEAEYEFVERIAFADLYRHVADR